MREPRGPEESASGCAAPCLASCYVQRVLQALDTFGRSGTLTDVVLRAGGRDFPCLPGYARSEFAICRL